MIRQIDVMHTRGTGSRSRTHAPWRAAISIVPAIILLFLTGFAERALAGSHDNTDEFWELGVLLDGKWLEKCRGGGDAVFQANQGSEVTFRYVVPCDVSMKKYGFQKNDVSIQGKFRKRKFTDGRKHTITGEIQIRFPLEFRKICPEQWSRMVPMTGEIAVEQKFSKIKFTVPRSEIDENCTITRKGTHEFELRRSILVESIRIIQTEPQIQEPAKIQLVSRKPSEIPYAKITVEVEFVKNAVPVLDAYPVSIAVENGPKRTVMARRVLSLQWNVYRIPWIKLVIKK